MAHVGVKRLGAGHRVDHRAERQERIERVGGEEAPDVDRAERPEDLRMADDVMHAHRRDRREIDQHDRAEHLADPIRAVRLDREQADQDRERDPHDVGLERGADDAEPLDRRDHRNRRRQHRVGKEQRGREQRADQQPALRSRRAQPPLDQRVEREAAALPSLSQRMTMKTYLIVTTNTNDQKIRLTIP